MKTNCNKPDGLLTDTVKILYELNIIIDVQLFLKTHLFIFRHIVGQFFPRKWNLHHVYERNQNIRYHEKGKYSEFAPNQSKNKLVGENDVSRVLARYSLWAPAYVGFIRSHRNITMFI